MYAIGTHAQDRFASAPATVPGYYVAAPQASAQPVGTLGFTAQPAAPAASYYVPAQQPVTAPVAVRTIAPQRTVYREAASPAPRVETRHRSVAKTALIIGGSTAGAAGLGGLLGGKKGALVGAALGGGAASIYEATRR
jgi:hypothetical protein